MENPQIRRHLYSKAAAKHVPLAGSFEITPRCNMNCKMCYVRLTKQEQESIGRERTAKEWIELGKNCRDAGMLFLLLTGGEPFLRPDFREIYEGLYDLGLMISINSNGTLLTAETVEWLKARPPVKINMTLYGGSKDTYQNLCRYPDGYERAVSAILMLKEAGLKVSINATYTGENKKDLEQIYTFIEENHLLSRMSSYMFPPVRKRESNQETAEHRMPPEDAARVMWEGQRFGCSEETWEKKREKLLSGVSLEDRECPLDEKMQCMAGRSSFWVTWNWQLRGCGMMTVPSVDIKAGEFKQAWDALGIQIDALRLPKACASCALRSVCVVCGAVAQAEGDGDMAERPEYVCQLTEEYVRLLREETIKKDKKENKRNEERKV